jgi:hypothetical protein
VASVGPDLSHRRTIVTQVLRTRTVRRAVRGEMQEKGIGRRDALKAARRYAYEIAANYSHWFITLMYGVLSWLWNRLYDGVELANFSSLESVAEGSEVVYVPCHRSHMDYLLLSYVVYHKGFAVPHIAAGINHMAFYLKFEKDGQDLYPAIKKVLNEKRAPDWNLVRYEIYKRFGYFVTESSEHFAEYTPWFIKRDRPDLIEKFNIPLDEYITRCENQIAGWHQLRNDLLTSDKPIEVRRSHEYGSLIIHSMETGQPRVVYGNVANTGLINNLPEGCCVEVPVLVDKSGLQPTKIGNLPPHLAAMMTFGITMACLAWDLSWCSDSMDLKSLWFHMWLA